MCSATSTQVENAWSNGNRKVEFERDCKNLVEIQNNIESMFWKFQLDS